MDLNSHTSMPHLYAAGETCCNGVHGANRLASNSLLESLVFAKSAAAHITESRSEEKNGSGRFNNNINLSLDELADIYELDLEQYNDIEKYMEDNKKQILEAIKKAKKESA